MNTLSFTLNGAGIIAGTYGAVLSLAGIVGVIVSTPNNCPQSIPASQCRATSHKAAGLAAAGLIGAGAGGLLIAGSRVINPEY